MSVLKAQTGAPVRLKDYIHPAKFPKLTEAVHAVSGFDPEGHSYRTPSLSLKLKHSLKACAEIIQAESLISGDEQSHRNAVEFFKLCDLNWKWEVSGQALTDLQQRKFDKPQLLPLTEDLFKLQKHLVARATENAKRLSKNSGVEAWSQLCQVILCSIVLFNRRRAGETERITLSQYQVCSKTSADSAIVESLSDLERRLCATT